MSLDCVVSLLVHCTSLHHSSGCCCRHDRRYALYTDSDVIWWRKARGIFGLSTLKVQVAINMGEPISVFTFFFGRLKGDLSTSIVFLKRSLCTSIQLQPQVAMHIYIYYKHDYALS